jgi:hypothetical protein
VGHFTEHLSNDGAVRRVTTETPQNAQGVCTDKMILFMKRRAQYIAYSLKVKTLLELLRPYENAGHHIRKHCPSILQ